MYSCILFRYLGPSTSGEVLSGLTFLNTPEPVSKPVKVKPNVKAKPGLKPIFPMRFYKFEFQKHSNYFLKKEAEEVLFTLFS